MATPQQDGSQTARALTTAAGLHGVLGRLKRRLRAEARMSDFSGSQVQVLTWLEREGPATVTTLARAHGMRSQSMGEVLAALKAAGLVSGAPDPRDGRRTVLSLTAACRRKIKATRAAREDWLSRVIQEQLAPAEQAQLAAAVELLKRLVDA